MHVVRKMRGIRTHPTTALQTCPCSLRHAELRTTHSLHYLPTAYTTYPQPTRSPHTTYSLFTHCLHTTHVRVVSADWVQIPPMAHPRLAFVCFG